MRKIVLFAALASCSTAAVAGWIGPGQQPITFKSDGSNVLGDGSDARGGIAPALENGSAPQELADIADNFTTSTYLTAANSRKTAAQGGSESKMRTMCNAGPIGHFDPIISPGTANFGHLHQFYGNLAITKDSDYSQLRQNGESTCAGDKINRTGYWIPAFMENLGSGVAAARKFDHAVIYYQGGDLTTDPPKLTRFARGFHYIAGYDPADPNNTKLVSHLAGPYVIPNGYGVGTSSGTGFAGWECLDNNEVEVNGSNVNSPAAGSSFQPYLRNANGTSTLTCPADGKIMAVLFSPACWDGKNLSSDNGRNHVSYRARNNNTGQLQCPDHWYRFPELEQKFVWSLKGTEDVGKFFLSSDVMNYGAPDPTSRSPCRQVSSNYCHGETLHGDWFGAWSYGTTSAPGPMLKWMNHCLGIKIDDNLGTMAGDPAECDTSTIDVTNALQVSGTTAGGLPFGNPGNVLSGAIPTLKYQLESGQTGTFIMQHPMP